MKIEDITDYLQNLLKIPPGIQKNILITLIVVFLVWLLRKALLKFILSKTDDVRSHYRWKKSTGYAAFFIAAVIVGSLWIKGVASFSTFLGLFSAGMAIALRDPLVDLAGWGFILWRKPFEVGDRIQSGEISGDVIDQRIFQFTLMEIGNWVDSDQSTGRVIHVPNSRVFTATLANYSKGFQFIWNEIPVLITFESDWRKAKTILQQIADKHSQHLSVQAEKRVKKAAEKFMIFYNKLTPTVYTSVRDCGVLLTIRYLSEPRRRRGTEQAIWEDILDGFATCSDIDFAYPTQRFYDNVAEGKEGTRPKPAGDRTE